MTFYISTPLFYVNDLPHIGSAYPTMAADFIAGHMLQRGEKVVFLTGTDEHGQKIEKAAAALDRSPKEHCDYIAAEFAKLWELLDIRYQYFRRTSDPDHYQFVAEFFAKVEAAGDIYKADYQGLYCVACEDFKQEKDLEEADGDWLCPVHKQKLERYSQQNYFFRLSKYQDFLKEHIQSHPEFIAPESRRNEVLGWVNEGLRDFPISRCNISWGIDLPLDTQQKIYVWFDALLGYISGLGSKAHEYWSSESKIWHIIGKDILRFHAVYWPAMLKSAGYPLPTRVFGHGFLTKDGMKMGKTLGNVIDPVALTQQYGSDALRFYFLREIVFGRDGDFSLESFIQRLNTDLANNLGNLLSRSLSLLRKYLANRVPAIDLSGIDSASLQEFKALEEKLRSLDQPFRTAVDDLDLHQALERLFATLSEVNLLLSNIAPWKKLKDNPSDKLAALSLALSVDACRRAALLLAPLCPHLSRRIFEQLGLLEVSDTRDRLELLSSVFAFSNWNAEPLYQLVLEPEPVFQRLELPA